jgi:hypothetical protein
VGGGGGNDDDDIDDDGEDDDDDDGDAYSHYVCVTSCQLPSSARREVDEALTSLRLFVRLRKEKHTGLG